MEEYRVRSKEGIERLVNLISLSYSTMPLLPYSDEPFCGYQSASKSRQISFGVVSEDFSKRLKMVLPYILLLILVKRSRILQHLMKILRIFPKD